MSFEPIYILGRGAQCAAGLNLSQIHKSLSFAGQGSLVSNKSVNNSGFRLPKDREFSDQDREDPAVRWGVEASQQALSEAQSFGCELDQQTSVVFSSSRGATHILEREHGKFVRGERIDVRCSPQSTAGAFSSRVAHEFGFDGISLSVSAACVSSLHAIVVACSLLQSRFTNTVVVGGSEAPLTGFTIEQMRRLRVLGVFEQNDPFPYRPFHPSRSGLVLGEGSAALVLSRDSGKLPVAKIVGVGAATEGALNQSATGVDPNGRGLQQSILMACRSARLELEQIDAIVAHGAGTKAGDAAEMAAYNVLFGDFPEQPFLTTFKWATGHLLGAGGILACCIASAGLRDWKLPGLPYQQDFGGEFSKNGAKEVYADTILITGLGFGGQSAAVLLARP